MSNVYVMDHPLIQHKIGLLRREETGSRDFRALVGEIAMLMCYEATRDLKLEDVKITTPICETTAKQLEGKKLAIVPVLISACTGTPRRWSRWSTTASCRQTVTRGRSSWWIRCWLQAAPARRPSSF